MSDGQAEVWDLWYPSAGATGMPFARGRIGRPTAVMLVHAAPDALAATAPTGSTALINVLGEAPVLAEWTAPEL